MKRILWFILSLLVVLTPAEAFSKSFSIVTGKQNRICVDALRVLHKMPKDLFSTYSAEGGWRSWFDEETNWKQKTTALRRLDGTKIPYGYSYANFDIDNDGKDDFIIWDVSSIRSVEMDFWFVFPHDKSTLALDSELSVSELEVPQIGGAYGSVGNFVPTEFARWTHNGVNLIVMREIGFPGRNKFPSSFLVTKYEGHVVKRGGMSIAEVNVICVIK